MNSERCLPVLYFCRPRTRIMRQVSGMSARRPARSACVAESRPSVSDKCAPGDDDDGGGGASSQRFDVCSRRWPTGWPPPTPAGRPGPTPFLQLALYARTPHGRPHTSSPAACVNDYDPASRMFTMCVCMCV